MIHYERRRGAPTVSVLGFTLCQLVTGEEPLKETSFAELMQKLGTYKPPWLGASFARLPQRLQGVILKCRKEAYPKQYQDLADLARGSQSSDRSMPKRVS